MWDKCGMSRNAEGLKTAIEEISSNINLIDVNEGATVTVM